MFKLGSGVLVALVVGLAGAVDVGAASGGGSLRATAPPASGFPGSSGPPEGAIEASRVKEARLRESWQSKASRDERKASRRRFKDLSRAGARALGEREHPSVFSPEVWAPLAGVKRRGGFLDAYSARVTLPNGTDAVAVSYLPLLARDEGGEQSAVDLDLVERSGALVPQNPLVETVIPERSSDPVRVGDIGFDLGGDAPVQLANNRAFYADAGGQDIDLVVMPTPSGVETFAQIRSVDAPEEVRMGFDLPAGTELRGVAGAVDGALEVVRGGEVIATVTRPLAVDAQQRPVPVEYRVEGNDLVMTVEHRSGDFAMPIMLDPSVVYGWNANPRRYDSTGWGVYQSNPASRWCSYFGDAYAGYGQYTFGRPESYQPCSSTWYSPYEVYEFNYYGEYRRGSTAFVEGWDEGTNFDAGWGGTCRYSGIYSVGLGRWETYSGNECQTAWNRIRYHRSPGTPPNYAVFGTVINGSGLRQNFTNHLWGATVYVSDRDNPTVEQGPRRIPTGWTKDTTFDVTARDAGIGVDWTQVRLSAPNRPDHLESRYHPCSADPANHCPSQDDFAYATNNMPEGERTLSAQAGDLIRQSPFTELGTIKIDRTVPTVTASGELREASGSRLVEETYDLSVAATDALSGVESVQVKVDGVVKATAAGDCSARGCGNRTPLDFTLRPDDLQPGTRTITVTAKDQAGNVPTNPVSWTVQVDDPRLALAGSLVEQQGSVIKHDRPEVLIQAEHSHGIKSIEVLLDGQRVDYAETPCPLDDDACVEDRTYEVPADQLAPGGHSLTVVATDAQLHQTQRVVSFEIGRAVDDGPVQASTPPPSEGSGPGCTVKGTGSQEEGVRKIVHGYWDAGPATTEYLDPSGYRIYRCNPDGSLHDGQEIGTLEVQNEVYDPEMGTFEVQNELVKVPVRWMRPVTPAEPLADDEVGVTENARAEYLDPSDPAFEAAWAEDGQSLQAQVIPPLPTLTPLPAPTVTSSAIGFDCDDGGNSVRDERWVFRPRYYIRASTLPRGARSRNRIKDGHRVWNNTVNLCGYPDRTDYGAIYAGSTTRTAGGASDKVDVVDFGNPKELGCPSTTGLILLACTRWFTKDRLFRQDRIYESDMRFRPGGWWHRPTFPREGTYDLLSLVAHEAGHKLGLNHPPGRALTMSNPTRPREVGGRFLGRGDVIGLLKLYKGQSMAIDPRLPPLD